MRKRKKKSLKPSFSRYFISLKTSALKPSCTSVITEQFFQHQHHAQKLSHFSACCHVKFTSFCHILESTYCILKLQLELVFMQLGRTHSFIRYCEINSNCVSDDVMWTEMILRL